MEHSEFATDTLRAMEFARQSAARLNHKYICTEHLLLGLLDINDPLINAILKQAGVSAKELRDALDFVVGKGIRPVLGDQKMDPNAERVLDLTLLEAQALRSREIRPEHLFLGLIREHDGIAAGILESFAITLDRARTCVLQIGRSGATRASFAADQLQRFQMTPTLNTVSRDLTAAALAGQLDPLIGRADELERTMQVISRRMKNNPVLIGPAGVGKTAIVEGLAYRIVTGQAPEYLCNYRVVALDVGLLTIGTKFRGDFEERLKKIVAEIVAAKNLIIVVDELHTLIGAGVAEGSVDAANLLKPILARGDFRCVGTTTFDDYRKTIERDPALERRFQPITVRETTHAETLAILEGLREHYERFHQVTITPAALRAAVTQSARYIQDRQLPDKAVDVIDEAAARLRVGRSVLPAEVRVLRERVERIHEDRDNAIEAENFSAAVAYWREERRLRADLIATEDSWRNHQASEEKPIVDEEIVATVVAAWTGVPVRKLNASEAERLLRLEDDLHGRVIGQDEAVAAVARAIRRSRVELRDRKRPIGSFIFAGPTGVGKTELARALAESLFGDEKALITFDMSEFMESHFAARLTGAPPGYVGYDQAGQLTEAVRRHPYSVVLFDEIEKAHTRIFDLLLQILEDGQFSDAKGRKVDFRNTVIIMTTNIGAQFALRRGPLGFAHGDERHVQSERLRAQIEPELKTLFRPEFLNRLDEIIIFGSHSPAQMRRIADLFLTRVQARVAEQHMELDITDAARDLIARLGFDPEYGARPLRRVVQRLLEDELAEGLLRGEYRPGDTIIVDSVDERLNLRVSVPVVLQHAT